MDRQPLPQVLPPAALFILGPCHRFSVGAAERREWRSNSACALAGFHVASPMVGGDGDLSRKDSVIFEETTEQNSMGRDVFALKDALSVLHLYYYSEGVKS